MPHVVIDGITDIQKIHNAFEKKLEKLDNTIIKFEDIFINQSSNTVLVSTILIEDNLSKKYLIQIMKKDNLVTIRLDPMTDPKPKTDGVKRSLGLVAKFILEIHKEQSLRIVRTNLNQFLPQ